MRTLFKLVVVSTLAAVASEPVNKFETLVSIV